MAKLRLEGTDISRNTDGPIADKSDMWDILMSADGLNITISKEHINAWYNGVQYNDMNKLLEAIRD
jgi:hypothetical protein